MKYSDHPMPLKEGEYPWEHIMVFDEGTRKWKDQWRKLEEADIKESEAEKWEGQIPETDTYYLAGKEEYYDFETVCKACGTQFIAYTGEGIETKAVRNFCPGCGKRLAEKDNEPDIEAKNAIKNAVNTMQWVQEYIEAIGEEHKDAYVNGLQNAMDRLMSWIKEDEE